MIEFTLPILEDYKDPYPAPEDYNYWKSRQDRTFFIDYEIGEVFPDGSRDNRIVELCKTIVQMNMDEMNVPKEELKPIYIYIYTYGGNLEESLMLCDVCLSSRIPIITVGMGVAMSGGFLILLAGHKRYAFNHCQMLVHSGSAGFQGTAEQIEEAQKNYKKQLSEIKDYILSRTSIDEKVFNKNRSKEWYLKREEIIDYHVVDKLIDNLDEVFERGDIIG